MKLLLLTVCAFLSIKNSLQHSAVDNFQIETIYNGCEITKTCFGIPDRCFQNSRCTSFVAVTFENNEFIFEVHSTTNQRYVASGVSRSQSMTDTSVIECVQENNGDILAYASLTIGRSVSRAAVNQSTIELIESRLIDGRLYCKVRKDSFTAINELRFDLLNDELFLLVASGTNILPNEGITRHDTNRAVSNEQFALIQPRITTEADDEYRFFNAPQPGITFNVQSSYEIQIALTPFNFPWTPMLEIFIGTANNTRSVIRRNQEIDVATVPTPNIIRDDEVNSFRIVVANFVVSVFRGNEQFAFMSFTMIEFFTVNFYGLRSPANRAMWIVEPTTL